MRKQPPLHCSIQELSVNWDGCVVYAEGKVMQEQERILLPKANSFSLASFAWKMGGGSPTLLSPTSEGNSKVRSDFRGPLPAPGG